MELKKQIEQFIKNWEATNFEHTMNFNQFQSELKDLLETGMRDTWKECVYPSFDNFSDYFNSLNLFD